jgi:flagellar hook-associated protein 3 FlgL
MNFTQLKEYLGETDDNVFTTKYLSGSNIGDWQSGTFWVPATCTHKNEGFLGLKLDGSTFVDYSVSGSSVMRQATITDKPPITSTQIKANVENYYYDGAPVKYSGDSFMDIGLDMSVAGNGKVAPKTAFRTTVDGIAAMGYGTSTVSYDDIKGLQASAGYQGSGSGSSGSETVCNNIYDMMNEMQKAIDGIDENNSNIGEVIDKISAVMVNFKKQTDNIIAAESEIGVRTQFLETNLDRLEAENTSLKKMQKDIETVDDATEITNFMSYQNAWNLVLQFGKNIVPKSLMDYVN